MIKPCVVWLTGLSGAGKTTIAKHLEKLLLNNNISPILLDGDEIRNTLNFNKFDEQSRKQHNLNVGYIASVFEKRGNVVLVSLIAPYQETRNQVKNICKNYIEVYVATKLETCIERDTKGLYKKALNGEINNFTGVSSPYVKPTNANIVIATENESAVKSAETIYNFLLKSNNG